MNEELLMSDLKKISIPRMVGSTGEHKVLTYIKEEIEKSKFTAFGDKVSTNDGYFQLKNRVYQLASIFCLLNAALLIFYSIFDFQRISAGFIFYFFSIFISIILISYIIATILKILNMEFIGTGSESRESMNIYCDKKTDRIQPFVLILIMAHYDSIGHSISYTRTKRNLIYVLVFGTLSLLFHLILSLRIFMDSNLILLYFAGLAIMFYLLTVLFLNHLKKIKVSNISPGGTDNASGVAICLNLIRYFEKINLSWCDLRFLFPAAEEFGLFGSKSHQTLHKGEFDRYLKTYIINIDTITDILCYQTFNTKKNNKTHNIEDIIKNVATSTKITLKKASQLIGGSDHIPFCKEGYESAFFFGQNHEFIHSEADTIDKITPKNVSDTLELIYRVILEIDRRASFIIESGSKKF